jgi:hypothetical protein
MMKNANNEFIGANLEFDKLMEQLQEIRANHFGANPETDRNWGEVGSVQKVVSDLQNLVDFLGDSK